MLHGFAVFILTHGRPESIATIKSLRTSGYSGKIYIVIDDEDKTADEYIKRFGDDVKVFSKSDAASACDSGTNSGKRGSILFARNWSYILAKNLGLTHFWQLDDDYTQFNWSSDNAGNYLNTTKKSKIKTLDNVLAACLEFLDASNAATVAFAQGGDFIGGKSGRFHQLSRQGRFARKAMNSFLCRTDRPIAFRGIFNEDVNTYVVNGGKGDLYVTIPRLRLSQPATQSQSGGITELYLDCGTYVKSMMTVMYAPSCVSISMMGYRSRRVHHRISWNHAVPRIVSHKYQKRCSNDQTWPGTDADENQGNLRQPRQASSE